MFLFLTNINIGHVLLISICQGLLKNKYVLRAAARTDQGMNPVDLKYNKYKMKIWIWWSLLTENFTTGELLERNSKLLSHQW